MTDIGAKIIRMQPRFKDIFENGGKPSEADRLPVCRIYGDEREFLEEALSSCLDGGQTERLGKELAEFTGVKYAIPMNSATAAIHIALKLAAERIYGSASGLSTPDGAGTGGALTGKRVFCSDFAPSASANAIVYEGGIPVFIDCGEEDWSMDPEVLERAFERYPDTGIVIMNHAYGFPGQIAEIKRICEARNAVLIEDASESLGASFDTGEADTDAAGNSEDITEPAAGRTDTDLRRKASVENKIRFCGSMGDYGILDFSKDKIITGGSGGALLADDFYSSKKAEYWASHSQAAAPWNQYEELGYDYLMSDLTAAFIRGQLKHLNEAIAGKKAVYERYLEKLDDRILYMNPIGEGTEPNYWRSCITCESTIRFMETRSERDYTYTDQHGTASPMEIYDSLEAFGIKSAPVYKPLSMQPVFSRFDQITLDGSRRSYSDFYNDVFWIRSNMAKQYFDSGLCLPCELEMTEEQQDRIIEVIHSCFCQAKPVKAMTL